ncbi:MAG: asparagine synthase (glutamine-hydrolyzing) [Acidobacteriota bacterium]|nr:asparagine synthase (glutamine-hydrolyzing) [Acidobacteriota bacterium]
MCGIVGFINKNGGAKAERAALLEKMCRQIVHRGPDEQGVFLDERAALGMRRLSIIDLKTGQQPIYDCTGNLAIVFNGEIYNFQEIKKDLERRGHNFKTNSDTETIVHLYEEFGSACVEHLRGMFAFAIWDKRAEKLFLARDRAGKKPLFYAQTKNGDFVFGSESKTLLEHAGIEREISFEALDAFLTFGYVPEEFCIFENIKKLPPAHSLEFQQGKIRVDKYWDFPLRTEKLQASESEIVAELQNLLAESVKNRLISEVPLGAFLSGGVDSSAVVGLMSRFSEKPVKTFSIGFEEDSYDELKFARAAAKHFNTEHHEFVVTPAIVEEIDNLVWHLDEPFADMSALPTFAVAKMAREFVTVALSGDGGDELFAGYSRYVNHFKAGAQQIFPGFVRRNLLSKVAASLPHGARGRNYLHNAALDSIEKYIDSVSHFGALNRRQLYSIDFRRKLNGAFGAGEAVFQRIAGELPADSLEQLLYLDSKTYLPADILTKVDRMTMAASLEARAPLLDHKLIEFVARIPADLKMRGGETKYIFKQALRGIVPDEILYREKQGFGVPVDVWINEKLCPRIRETLLEGQTAERGFFDLKYIEILLKEHATGRRDHAWRLWQLFVFELWQRRFIDGN